jgi:RHS repeat-associated protein
VPLLLSDGANDYIYGPNDKVVEQVAAASGTPAYLHQDRAGSTRLITDGSGAVIGSNSYDPYGDPVSHTGTASSPFGYDGEYTDVSGLVFLRARYYDPATGQFITVDPLVDATRTPYAFAGDNPVNNVDPSGDYEVHSGPDADAYGYSTQSNGSDGGEPPRPMPHPGSPLPSAPSSGGVRPTPDQGSYRPDDYSLYDVWMDEHTPGTGPYTAWFSFMFSLTGIPDAASCARGSTGGCISTAITFAPMGKAVRGLADLADALRAEKSLVNLASDARTIHVLYGDATGGGHLWPGLPRKTPFPKSWSAGQIMHAISDISTDPAAWENAVQQGSQTVLYGTRDGVKIKVVVDVGADEIITGTPVNLPRNP